MLTIGCPRGRPGKRDGAENNEVRHSGQGL
jgi:hypothetical protein